MAVTAPTLLLGNDPAALQRAVLDRCVGALQAERAQGTAGTVLWIVPTHRAQRQGTSRLVTALGAACLAPPCTTFDGFAERLLHAAGRPATAISPTVRRLILRRITQSLAAADELPHFQRVATTSGFLDVVEGFIAELKRDEIWPEDFQGACARSRRVSPRDRELGTIYERYQEILLQQNWYDAAGRFWLARTELAEGRCRGLPHWSWIGVSGFADFTRTQSEILELLAARTDQLLFTLPADVGGRRTSLFEKSTLAANVLRRTWPELQTEHVSSIESPSPFVIGSAGSQVSSRTEALESADRRRLRECLFGNPRETQPAETSESIEIVACTGSDSEITSVALKIKGWLAGGVAPGEIAVGLRSLNDEGIRWRDGLAAAGLPVWCDVGAPVQQSGLVKFLLAVLQAELEDWPFARLTGVLGSSYLRPRTYPGDSRRDARAVSRALRGLRLPQGRHELLTGVERAAARFSRSPGFANPGLPDDADDPIHSALPADVYIHALRLLKWYAQVTEVLRKSRTLGDWVDALAELLEELGAITRAASDGGDPDRPVWDQWQRLLRDAAAAELLAQGSARKLAAGDFLAELRDLLVDERRDPPPEPAGCIRILGLDQLRHLETPYLVAAGLTEESFPRRRSDDCLFSDSERRAFVEQGLPLRHAALHQQEELLFFHHVALSATRRLVLTYPEVNHRGQPAFPSPYVAALRTLWTSAALPIQHEGQLDPIPDSSRVVTATEVRLAAMQAAMLGRPGWLRALWEAPQTHAAVSNIVAAVEMALNRFETRGFTSYEGRLEHPVHQQSLAERFHPRWQFSATELESYAACPFKFWLSTVLKVEELPDVESGTDVLRRGVVVHDVLARLADGMRPSAAGAQLADRFQRLVSEKLDEEVPASELEEALLKIEQQVLSEWGAAYAAQFEQYASQVRDAWGGPWNATDPEVPFGDMPNLREDQRRPPLELGDAENRVLVRGRIDRIDSGVVQQRPVFTVIDYKTGRRPSFKVDDVRSGRSLQLVLYAIAARRLGLVPADALPFQLGYWCLRETGFQTGLKEKRSANFQAIDAAAWAALEEIVDETIPRLAAGIRSGEFVVDNTDEDCTGRCAYSTVCRVNQIRPIAERLSKVRGAHTGTGEPF